MLDSMQKNQVILIAQKIYENSTATMTSKGHVDQHKKAYEQAAQNSIALAEVFFKESEEYKKKRD